MDGLEMIQEISPAHGADQVRGSSGHHQLLHHHLGPLRDLQRPAAPLLEVADPLLQVDLAARLARAELRALLALVDLLGQIDRLNARAHLSPR